MEQKATVPPTAPPAPPAAPAAKPATPPPTKAAAPAAAPAATPPKATPATTPPAAKPALTGILAKITSGRIVKSILAIIYGPDGVGKSTFAAGAPKPIFIAAEDGSNSLDVNRLAGINTFAQVLDAMAQLVTQPHDFQTLVLDSLDWIERLIYEQVCIDKNVNSIEDIGYGKGYQFALDKWRSVIDALTLVRESRGMNVLLIAHAKIKKFEDPATPQGYERYQLKLQTGPNTDAAALLREFVDTVLFANYVTVTTEEDKRRGFADGTRMLYTERRPGYDAKNRLGLPPALPLSWQDFMEAAAKGEPNSPDRLIEQCKTLMAQVKDKTLHPAIEKAITNAGKNAVSLAVVKNRIEAVMGKEG